LPLPLPILDDRSYQQLRDELVRRIPVYNPEWTDHNASDPGITLLELFAFLGENLLYRFNQIPESTRLAFLKLLQIPLRAAVPARALIAVEDPQFATRIQPARLDPDAVTARSGQIPFSIATEVTVSPWKAVVIGRAPVAPPTTPDGQEFAQVAIDALELGAGQTPAFYVNRVVPDDPAAPEAAPVDFGATVDGTVWIAVLGDVSLLAKMLDLTLNVGFVPDLTILPEDPPVDPCPGLLAGAAATTGVDPNPAEELVWEISTGRFDGRGEPVYQALDVAGDTTRGLRQQGVVRLRLPHAVTELGNFDVADTALLGTGALPPVLDDPTQQAAVLFWLRGWRRAGQEKLGRALWLGLNAAEVLQQEREPPELLGIGDGQAGQRLRLLHGNVVADSLVIEVEESPGTWAGYTAVDSFDASREDDRHYVVDLEAGEVRFGNGVQGHAPQIGERVRATAYSTGGGVAGNVAAKSLSTLEGVGADGLKAANPLAARGGADAETVAAALERLPGELRRHDRAVTVGDFRELALATPGADLGRAECLPLYYPPTGATDAAGVVSVVVWPREDPKHPDAPMPDRETLRRVCEWLDARRLVTTELYVIPPRYVPVAVSVGLRVKPGYGVDAVRSWVEKVIRQYLAPLPPYGPEGQGWPLGRRVYGPELEAAALQVEGVQYVETDGVAVARLDGGTWVTGTVELGPNEVPELVAITVVQGPRLEPGASISPPPLPETPVPVPTVPEEC
jgi:hypothetical protein